MDALNLLKKMAGELLKGGPALPIPREKIPRFVWVMDNLADPRVKNEKERIRFCNKFAESTQGAIKKYSISDPHPPATDPSIITPPKVIYARGLPQLYTALRSRSYVKGGPLLLAIVGPISPRVNANVFAERLAEIAVRRVGATIVSGFAEGIDKHAHLGALNAGGKTIAFLPHGIMNEEFYTETTLLKYLIPLFGGGFVSEYYKSRLDHKDQIHMKIKGNRREFTANANQMLLLRDGRTTALADAVVIVEAAKYSGSVDTGRRAYLQGKPVFVVDWRMVELQFTKGLPDVINGGLKELVNEGCAIPFPPREKGLPAGQAGKKIPLNELPKLFLEFIIEHLEKEKHSAKSR